MSGFCDYVMVLEPVGFRNGRICRPSSGGNLLVCCMAPAHDGNHMVETPENRLMLDGPL